MQNAYLTNAYLTNAIRTCKSLPYPEHLTHMALGLSGETFEVNDVLNIYLDTSKISDWKMELTKELGDICWYAAGLCFKFDHNDKPVLYIKPNIDEPSNLSQVDLMNAVGEIVEDIKKHVIYDKDYDQTKLKNNINKVFKSIMNICQLFDISFHDVLNTNIEKLRKRYPNAYSNTDAINRVDTK